MVKMPASIMHGREDHEVNLKKKAREQPIEIPARATIEASTSEEAILALMRHTDTIAEIHNTLRQRRM